MLLSSAVVGSETLVVMSTTRHFFLFVFCALASTLCYLCTSLSGYAPDACSALGSPEVISVTVC